MYENDDPAWRGLGAIHTRDAEIAALRKEAEGLREAVRVMLEAAEESYRHFRSLSKVDQSVVWDAMCDQLSKSMSIAKAAIDAAGGASG